MGKNRTAEAACVKTARRRRVVALVEDQKKFRDAIGTVLRDGGFEVVTPAIGSDPAELAREIVGADAVVLDHHLGHDVPYDGRRVAAEFRKIRKDKPRGGGIVGISLDYQDYAEGRFSEKGALEMFLSMGGGSSFREEAETLAARLAEEINKVLPAGAK